MCDLPPAEAAALLATECGDDPELGAQVSAMLRVDHDQSPLDLSASHPEHASGARLLARELAHSVLGALGTGDSSLPLPDRVGEFRVLRRIGAGGMGTVFEAEQERPQRRVALKVIHPHLVSERSLALLRFESEALAKLLHPGIPQIYAVGEAQGTFHFAMELVDGPTLLDFARALSLERKLALLAEIADAVHHAHLRGFIHRDLKPDNIRVLPDGRPKVLDFGISRSLDALPPVTAAPSGTLPFMAPEQVLSQSEDARVDIYALGLIAWELLAGKGPFELQGLSLEDAVARVAAGVPRRFEEALPGVRPDLASIVHRATAREPEDRYPSAADLAADLRRSLAREPVEAHGRSPRYLLSTFVRRHRALVAFASLAVIALVAGGATSFALYRRAEASRADEALERQRAEATVRFLTSLLSEAHPNKATGREVTVREALERSARELDQGALRDQPAVEVAVRRTLGETFDALGDLDQARHQLERAAALFHSGALAPGEEEARLWSDLGDMDLHAGLVEEAEERVRAALAIERALHGEGASPHEADLIQTLGEVLREEGRFADSEREYRRAMTLYEGFYRRGKASIEPYTGSMNQLAYLLALRGRPEEAKPLYERALALDTEAWGPDHPEIATDLHHLAWFARARGDLAEADRLLQRAYAIRLRTLGPRHPRVGVQKLLEAGVRMDEGRLDDALHAADEGLSILTEKFGPTHSRVVRYRLIRARVLAERGQLAEAAQIAHEVAASFATRQKEGPWQRAEAEAVEGAALMGEGKEEGALLLQRALEVLRSQVGPDSPLVLEAERVARAATSRGTRRADPRSD